MKSLFKLILLILLVSCNEADQNKLAHLDKTEGVQAVKVQMENKTFGIEQNKLEPQKVIIANDSIQFELWEDGNPLKLNFNLFNTDILNQGTATYTIPDANSGKVKVDLNFYNRDREAKTMNKRIIFRKGTITISKITENELHMVFEGDGSGVMEYGKNFPISGKVSITY